MSPLPLPGIGYSVFPAGLVAVFFVIYPQQMLPTLKYLIIDDDEIDRLAMEMEALTHPFLQKIAVCAHPLEAMELIRQTRPDIIFVDIEMPDLNGLEMVTRLAGSVPAPVFVTSHPEYALESYEKQAFDYILKPLVSERFAACARRLRDFFDLRVRAHAYDSLQQDELVIKQGYDKYKVRIAEILYLDAMKDYTRVVTASGQYLVLNTLTAMQEQLPGEKFIRIHRSFVVNRDHILYVQASSVRVQLFELPVSRLYKNSLKTIFS